MNAVDSDGNIWYQVPYLAQDTIEEPTENNLVFSPDYYLNRNESPYILKLKKVNRRFVSQFIDDTTLEISFGSGVNNASDETIIPNPYNVGLGIQNGISKINTAFDPSNFFFTNEYGLAPRNTTITFTYVVGGGPLSNVPSNDINQINTVNPIINDYNLDQNIVQTVIDSISFNNDIGATGGGPGDTLEEIRQNTLAQFPTQLRNVTKADYLVRTLSMDPKYGYISKAYVDQPLSLNSDTDRLEFQNNSLALDVYILSKNTNNKLTNAGSTVKRNLKTYLSQYKMLTDAINIKDAYYINIGINFEIQVLQGFNSQQVLLSAINSLKQFFDIDKWSINQPIILSQVENAISCAGVNGVAAVKKLEFINKNGGNYSPFAYDLNGATLNGIIYPSLDPSVFEIRYPDSDISGRVVGM
jgi:hypothetical protein